MRNYKHSYPFILGTTSYILHVKRNNLVANVRYLKDHLDLVQLLFFAKDYLSEVMSPGVLRELGEIKKRDGVSYLVHLPLDLGLGQSSRRAREEGFALIERIVAATEFLDVQKYILHVDGEPATGFGAASAGQGNGFHFNAVLAGLKKRLGQGSAKIAVENTNYDLTDHSGAIEKYDYAVCMDVGHLLRCDQDIGRFIRVFGKKISVLHLHGYKNGRDHRSLKFMDKGLLLKLFGHVKYYGWALIIEVFNKRDLRNSLVLMEKIMNKGQGLGRNQGIIC